MLVCLLSLDRSGPFRSDGLRTLTVTSNSTELVGTARAYVTMAGFLSTLAGVNRVVSGVSAYAGGKDHSVRTGSHAPEDTVSARPRVARDAVCQDARARPKLDGFGPLRPHLEACSFPGGPSWPGSLHLVRLELLRVSQPICAACSQVWWVRSETFAHCAWKHAAAEQRSAG